MLMLMLPTEVIFGSVTAVIAIIGALFGGGLLKQAFSHSNQMAIQKHELAQTNKKVAENDVKLTQLVTDMALTKKDVEGFQQHVAKLELIPGINTKLSSLEVTLGFLREALATLTSRDKH